MKLRIFFEEKGNDISKFTNKYWHTASNELIWVICKGYNSHITSSLNKSIFLTTTKINLLVAANPQYTLPSDGSFLLPNPSFITDVLVYVT